jgi:rare lipoprotein A (peptidoglycan hydrolase)
VVRGGIAMGDGFERVNWPFARPCLPIALALSVAGCVTSNTRVATAPSADSDMRTAAWIAPPPARPAARTVLIPPAPPRALSDFRPSYSTSKSFEGIASYYWEGSRVATGAPYNPHGMTAAHRSLPFGTRVRVSDPKTQRSVVVTINDRGPYIRGRVIDLSLGAARALGIQSRGISRVHADVL